MTGHLLENQPVYFVIFRIEVDGVVPFVMPVEALDDMSKSALQELSNMIMGNSATLLFNEECCSRHSITLL